MAYSVDKKRGECGVRCYYEESYDHKSARWCGIESKIDIPEEINGLVVREIGLSGCEGVQYLGIPASVEWIAPDDFCRCERLRHISVSHDNMMYSSIDGIVYSKNGSMLVVCPPCHHDFAIHDGTTVIGRGAFYSSQLDIEGSRIENLFLPNSVEEICRDAFAGCKYLQNIEFSMSLKKIGEGAFYGCESLTSVAIPGCVESVGNVAFKECTRLQSVSFQYGVKRIGKGAFSCCSEELRRVCIPASVIEIGTMAFSGVEYDVSPDNQNYISQGGVLYNKDMSAIISVPRSLRDFAIPATVQRIENCAFYNCTELETVTIPDSVNFVGMCAFGRCPKLKPVRFPRTIETISDEAFSG